MLALLQLQLVLGLQFSADSLFVSWHTERKKRILEVEAIHDAGDGPWTKSASWLLPQREETLTFSMYRQDCSTLRAEQGRFKFFDHSATLLLHPISGAWVDLGLVSDGE